MDDMTPEAQRAIRLAREECSPSDDDKRRVRRALGVGLAATAAAAGAASTEAAAATKAVGTFGAWVGLKGVVSMLLVASVGTGVYWWSHRATQPASLPSPPATHAELPPAPAPVAEEPAPAPAETSAAPVQPQPDRDARDRSARAADPLASELTLLHRAQQAWHDGKAQQTLELAQQHAATYPRSQFAMERSVLQVFALCALGRKSEAHAIASDLLKRAPRSPLRTSLEESCAMK